MKQYPLIRLAVMLATLGGDAHAGELGRLFTTPAERALLDQRRHLASSSPDRTGPEAIQAGTQEPVPLAEIVVNGVVYRRHGRSAIWINHVRQDAAGVSEFLDGTAMITLPGRGVKIRIQHRDIGRDQAVKE